MTLAQHQPAGAQPTRTQTRRGRGWIIAIVAVVGLLILAAVTATVSSKSRSGSSPLDPTNPRRPGAQALAEVLEQHGVQITTVNRVSRTKDLRSDSTVVVMNSELLSRSALEVLRDTRARVVLVEPAPEAVDIVAPDLLRSAPQGTTAPVSARCQDPIARRAGTITGGGARYHATEPRLGVVTCFGGRYATSRGMMGQQVTVVSQSDIFTNATIRDNGNAALAVGLLGRDRQLTWLMSSPLDPGTSTGGTKTRPHLMPPWFSTLVWLSLLTVLLLMFARGRRFGRLVTEPLPVVVHAAETVHGRATLYRRIGAHDRALNTLRAHALRRAATRLGLPRSATGPAIITAWAATIGADEAHLHAALLQPLPDLTSAELLHRVDDIDALSARLDDATAGLHLKGTP